MATDVMINEQFQIPRLFCLFVYFSSLGQDAYTKHKG